MGRIHIHVQTGHLRKHPEEGAFVKRFTDLFDVTHAESTKLDSSTYSIYYLKPNAHTTGMYGLAKEILLLYVPYPVLDTRTFKHATEIMDRPGTSGRLERVCYVLVSDSDDLTEQMARMQDERTQSALPIPFATGELQGDHNPWLLRTRFAATLFARDLFDMEQALVEDSYFFGRQSFVFELRDRFRKGENTGLYGLRKSGKTSAIFKLERLIATEKAEQLVYIDAQTPEVYTLRWWELLSLIKDRLANQLRVELPAPLDRAFTERTAVKRFRLALDAVFAAKAGGLRRVLLVFDEIEHICPELSPQSHWNQDFLPFWKLLRAAQTADRRFAFLIVGVNATASERTSVNGQDNPLFSLVGSRYIPQFDRHETKMMVQTLGRYMGLDITDDACEYLVRRYGGHPLLMRLACSWEHQRLLQEEVERPVTITASDLELRESTRDAERVQYVKHIVEVLRRWYPDEYELLIALATGSGETFREYAITLPETVQHLRAYNLLREPGPEICIAMVALFLRNAAYAPPRPSVARRVTEPAIGSEEWLALTTDISALRNRLEPKLRKFVRMILKGQLGAERWIDPVLEAIPKERRERLRGVDREEILADKIFFLDLLQVIEANWERFKHIESADPTERVTRSQIKVLMDFVNANRADAHAKSTARAEVATVAIACDSLDHMIERYLN